MLFRSLEVKPLPGLIDIDFGNWQGLSPEEVASRYSLTYAQWLESPHLVRFPEGESLEQVRERVATALSDLLSQHREGTIVLVSHKVVCKVLVISLLGLDNSHFWQVEQDVCAINLFKIGERVPITLLLNDTCHLKGLM